MAGIIQPDFCTFLPKSINGLLKGVKKDDTSEVTVRSIKRLIGLRNKYSKYLSKEALGKINDIIHKNIRLWEYFLGKKYTFSLFGPSAAEFFRDELLPDSITTIVTTFFEDEQPQKADAGILRCPHCGKELKVVPWDEL